METGIIAKMREHQDRLVGDRERHHATAHAKFSQIKAIPSAHEVTASSAGSGETGHAASVI